MDQFRDRFLMDRQNFLDWYPAWMDTALKELGQKAIAGEENNDRIVEYLKEANLVTGDETDWCSAYVNWVLRKSGYSRTKMPNAKSWRNWGKPIDSPRYGAVTVFWRETPASWKGHVAFFVEDAGNSVVVLGGNQGRKVSKVSYPKSRLLGYRWPYEQEYDKK